MERVRARKGGTAQAMADNPAQSLSEPETAAPRRNNKQSLKRFFAGLILAGLVGGAAYWWFFLRGKESTDNAYVMADPATVASRVPGTIATIFVENDDPVAQGQHLVELDPADYRAQLNEVEAALARVQAEIQSARVNVEYMDATTLAAVNAAQAAWNAAQAQVRGARETVEEMARQHDGVLAEYRHAKRDWERYETLAAQGASSVRDRDRMKTALSKAEATMGASEARLRAARAGLEAAEKEAAKAEARLAEAQAGRLRVRVEQERLTALRAQEKELEARRESARLNLSYCRIASPIAGYVAQKRSKSATESCRDSRFSPWCPCRTCTWKPTSRKPRWKRSASASR